MQFWDFFEVSWSPSDHTSASSLLNHSSSLPSRGASSQLFSIVLPSSACTAPLAQRATTINVLELLSLKAGAPLDPSLDPSCQMRFPHAQDDRLKRKATLSSCLWHAICEEVSLVRQEHLSRFSTISARVSHCSISKVLGYSVGLWCILPWHHCLL